MTNEMTHVTGASRGINGLRSAHHISKTSMVTFFFIVFFETEIGWQHLKKIWKKLFNNFFPEESP